MNVENVMMFRLLMCVHKHVAESILDLCRLNNSYLKISQLKSNNWIKSVIWLTNNDSIMIV